MNRSLQQRLLASLIAATIGTWLAVAAINFAVARNEVLRIFDAHLIHRKIVFDHILYNTLSRVRLVKHSAY